MLLREYRWDIAIGAMASSFVVLLAGSCVTLVGAHYTSSTQPRAWETDTFDWQSPLIVLSIGMGIIAFCAWRRWQRDRRGFAVGALFAFGVMLLIEGACFFKSFY